MRLALLAAIPLGLLLVAPALAQTPPPGLPATFFGSASIDGSPAPDGTEVLALIDGIDCTSDGTRGTALNDGLSTYVVQVLGASEREGCGTPGSVVTFTIAGEPTDQMGEWQPFPQQLDLNAGAGEPIPLPTLTPSPQPTLGSTAAPTGTGVASSATVPSGPVATSGSGGGGTTQALGIILLISGLAIALGAGAIALSRRKPG